MKRVAVIFGTRPEAIKLGPVVAAMHAVGETPLVVCSGQHWTLLEGTPAESDLDGAINMHSASDGNVPKFLSVTKYAITSVLKQHNITRVVVQGDTMTALAGARGAKDANCHVTHVEAGIRSYNRLEPWPEEIIRTTIACIADLHLAPTQTAFDNLLAESVPAENIRLTGNPVVSAITRYTTARVCEPAQPGYIVVTLHRRELVKQQTKFAGIARQVLDSRMANGVEVRWFAHPATVALIPEWVRERLHVEPPLNYERFLKTLSGALGVLTDSGGLQEEAACLGVPCAVLRNVTDRPEAVEAGIAHLCGATAQGVYDGFGWILTKAREPRRSFEHLYGDSRSAERCAQEILRAAS